MADNIPEDPEEADFNVLTSRWLEVVNLNAQPKSCSPMEALETANTIQCVCAASPLDLLAAHRFLTTLLYWKAAAAGCVLEIRQSLLRGQVPIKLLAAIRSAASQFRLFDHDEPFLQDPSACGDTPKSPGYFFAECACATNVALFHHGDDRRMRLCLRCATIGVLRVIPWTQSGGAGLSPSVHNAPPIMAMACGENLAVTLGLNLVPLAAEAGNARWSGHFKPSNSGSAIPFLEAFTWNPRRIHLLSPQETEVCWRCGRRGVIAVGPVVFSKNANTTSRKEGKKNVPFAWRDPWAFYGADTPYSTIKSHDEALAGTGRDLAALLNSDRQPTSAVVKENPDHRGWRLVIPCTNPANNKTFDHRILQIPGLFADSLRQTLPASDFTTRIYARDGWMDPRSTPVSGAVRFVQSATRLLNQADWVVLSAAAYRGMAESPAAFDLLSGLLWFLRGQKIAGLPSREAAWLVLKLMANVPCSARMPHRNTGFSILRLLPKRQLHSKDGDRSARLQYPISFPRGRRLEANLRFVLDLHLRRRRPEPIDWARTCHELNQLLS